jgi:hypothetical protein
MYIQSFRLQIFIFLVVESILIVVEALPSNHILVRDGSSTILPETGPSSQGLDSALQDSDLSSLGDNLYSLEDSTGILALASTPIDSYQPLLHGFEQLATDIDSTDQGYPFYDFGSPAEPGYLSSLDDTIGSSEISSDQPDLAPSGDLAGQDPLDEGSFTLAYDHADLFAPEDEVLSGDNNNPDTAHSTEDTGFLDGHTSSLGEYASNPWDDTNSFPDKGISVSSTVTNFPSEEMSLLGEDTSFPTEETNLLEGGISFMTEDINLLGGGAGFLTENTNLLEEDTSFPTGDITFAGQLNTEDLSDADGSLDTKGSLETEDSWDSEGLLDTESSYTEDSWKTEMPLDTEGSLVAIGEKARTEGTTETPTCSNGKIAACCLSKQPGNSPSLRDQCITCTFFSCLLLGSCHAFQAEHGKSLDAMERCKKS